MAGDSESGPLSADDFIDGGLRDLMKQIISDIKGTVDQFDSSLKQLGTDFKNELGDNLPQTEAKMNLLNEALKRVTKGSRDWFLIKQQLNEITRSEKELIDGATSSYKAAEIALGKTGQAYKDMAIAQGINSKAAQDLLVTYNAQLATITKVDNSMNNYRRNVGNYSNSINASLGKLTEGSHVLRALGEAFGVHLGPIREYVQGIRGLTELIQGHMEATKKNTEALEANNGATQVNNEQLAENTLATETNTIATDEQTISNEALAASNVEVGESFLLAIPIIGWIIGGLVALGAIIGVVVLATKAHRQALEDRSKAVDGSIIVDKEAREEYNKDIEKIAELTDKYKVLSGQISEYQATLNKMVLSHKTDMAEFENTTKEKLENAVSWWQSGLQRISNAIIYQDTFKLFDKPKDITDVFGIFQTKSDKELQENLAVEKQKKDEIAADQILNTIKQQGLDLDKLKYENFIKLSNLQNERVKNDYVRESAKLQNDKNLELEKNDPTGQAYKTDAIINEKKLAIENEYNEKIITMDKEYREKRKEQDLSDIVDRMKANYDREGEIRAQHDKDVYELRKSQMARGELNEYTGARTEVARQEDLTLEENYQHELTALEREHEDIRTDLQTKHTDLIKSSLQKQLQAAQDSYDDDLIKYNRLYEDKKITLDQYIQYNKDAADKLKEQNQKIDETSGYALQKLIDKNLVDSAKNKLTADKLKMGNLTQAGSTNARTLRDDQLDVVNGTNTQAIHGYEEQQTQLLNGRSLDDLKNTANGGGAAGEKEVLSPEDIAAGKTPEQTAAAKIAQDSATSDLSKYNALQAALTNAKKEGANERLQIEKDYNSKVSELRTQQIEQSISALKESLANQNKLEMDALKTKADDLNSEAQVQATLAAAGKKNTLNQALADQAANQEQQAALARKAKAEQDALTYSSLLVNAVNTNVKAGDSFEQAVMKAVTDVFLTKALAAGIAGSFFTGTEDTGGAGTMDSQGGKLIIAHPHERIIDAEKNARLGGISNEKLVDDYLAMKSMLMPVIRLDQKADDQVQAKLFEAAASKIADRLESAINNQSQITSTTDGNGNVVTQILRNGNRTTIIKANAKIIERTRHLKN